MIVVLHVLIALASIVYTAYAWVRPSQAKLRVSYVLAGATLASGTYLVVSMQTHLVEACVMGLLYFAAVAYGIVSARNKLATVKATKN